ncbi:MAG: cytochrome c maturation protein CcmE [Alphaproteobacteria bacterium]|jgi:cytochrome c-type biogenesis protein CcmE|nr:cytochrome c maturation protein CcmE [Alphaproteobacteria bacterium]
MSLLPRSRTARRRLFVLAAAAPVLALAAGLTLYGLRGAISYFYTPAQAASAHVAAGQTIQLGGLVETGSVRRRPDGSVNFVIADRRAADPVVFRGALPDLFREGQGVVATGAFDRSGVFEASQVLAKHDEKYMPKNVADALKAQGEWRGGGAQPSYAEPGPRVRAD